MPGNPKGWDPRRRWLQETGIKLFESFFDAYPEEQAKFKKFSNAPPSQLVTLPSMRRQALDTMCYLDEMIYGDTVRRFDSKVRDHAGWGVYSNSFAKMLDFMPGFFAANGGDKDEWSDMCRLLKCSLP